jgi:hypothetical protein
MSLARLLATLFAIPALAFGADSAPTITILEGNAAILRGGSRLAAAEGVRMQVDDVLETASWAFLRLEYASGPILDLGPGTGLMLGSYASTGNARPALYLLDGWLKLTGRGETGSQVVSVASPRMDLTDLKGVSVMHVGVDTSMVFIESGQARVLDRRLRSGSRVKLRGGEYVEFEGNKVPVPAPKPSAAFVAAVPAPFRDSLPVRLPVFAERSVAPRNLGTFNYKDVEAWLKDRALGRRLVRVWGAKANDPAFRARLVANLAAHPEWFPVLYPDCCDTAAADGSGRRPVMARAGSAAPSVAAALPAPSATPQRPTPPAAN